MLPTFSIRKAWVAVALPLTWLATQGCEFGDTSKITVPVEAGADAAPDGGAGSMGDGGADGGDAGASGDGPGETGAAGGDSGAHD